MNEISLHKAFVEALTTKIPKKSNLAEFVAVTLCMEKETAYRRLRGEVNFTLREAGILAMKLSISLDELLHSEGAPPSQNEKMRMALPMNYLKGTYGELQITNMLAYMEQLTTEKDSECGGAVSCLPYPLFQQYSLIARFLRLKYLHHAENNRTNVPFEKVVESEAKVRHRQELYLLFREVSYTYYIWDRKIIPMLVDDIKYAQSIRLIKDSEVEELKKEIFRFLKDLENIAAKGRYEETGNRFELYISDAHIDTGYLYFSSSERHVSMISSFVLFATISHEYIPYMRISNWIKSIKRFSTLISDTGERERIIFFEEQRAIVETL